MGVSQKQPKTERELFADVIGVLPLFKVPTWRHFPVLDSLCEASFLMQYFLIKNHSTVTCVLKKGFLFDSGCTTHYSSQSNEAENL
jgi:hypothetical protein